MSAESARAWTAPSPTALQPVRGLWRAARAGRLPHALLFHGPRGIGKFNAARAFALGLFCARGVPEEGELPCGTCGPCKRALSGKHLDLFVLDVTAEGEENIKLDRVVERPTTEGPTVGAFLALRAAEGGSRVLLVREAERLAHSQGEAQNSLLKSLEEPGDGVVWVLETSRRSVLLETVRSRCVAVRFERPGEAEARDVLADLGAEVGAEVRRWARGAPGEALDLHRRSAPALRDLSVGVLLGEKPPVEAARAAFQVEGDFPGKTERMRARALARTTLDLAAEVLADLLRLGAGLDPERLAHGDLAGRFAGADLSPAGLRPRLDAVLHSLADVEANVDPALVLEGTFLALGPPAARRRTRGGGSALEGAGQ